MNKWNNSKIQNRLLKGRTPVEINSTQGSQAQPQGTLALFKLIYKNCQNRKFVMASGIVDPMDRFNIQGHEMWRENNLFTVVRKYRWWCKVQRTIYKNGKPCNITDHEYEQGPEIIGYETLGTWTGIAWAWLCNRVLWERVTDGMDIIRQVYGLKVQNFIRRWRWDPGGGNGVGPTGCLHCKPE